MDTVTLSTKGQLVVPSHVREALRLAPGSRLTVAVENDRIVLKPEHPMAWKPLNPRGQHLSAKELSPPVDLSDDADCR